MQSRIFVKNKRQFSVKDPIETDSAVVTLCHSRNINKQTAHTIAAPLISAMAAGHCKEQVENTNLNI